MSDILRKRRLQWLGHMARMPEGRLPVQLLFGWLLATRPAHGPCLRWKDRIRSDLQRLQVSDWSQTAQERQEWRTALFPMRCHDHLEFHATSVVGFSRADRVKPGTNVPQRTSFLFRNSPELSSVRNASDGSRVLGALLCTSAALSLVRRLSLHFQLVCPSLHFSAVVFTATLATVVSAPVLVSSATTATVVIAQWTVKHLSMRA